MDRDGGQSIYMDHRYVLDSCISMQLRIRLWSQESDSDHKAPAICRPGSSTGNRFGVICASWLPDVPCIGSACKKMPKCPAAPFINHPSSASYLYQQKGTPLYPNQGDWHRNPIRITLSSLNLLSWRQRSQNYEVLVSINRSADVVCLELS
jgi:hypothetical protein